MKDDKTKYWKGMLKNKGAVETAKVLLEEANMPNGTIVKLQGVVNGTKTDGDTYIANCLKIGLFKPKKPVMITPSLAKDAFTQAWYKRLVDKGFNKTAKALLNEMDMPDVNRKNLESYVRTGKLGGSEYIVNCLNSKVFKPKKSVKKPKNFPNDEFSQFWYKHLVDKGFVETAKALLNEMNMPDVNRKRLESYVKNGSSDKDENGVDYLLNCLTTKLFKPKSRLNGASEPCVAVSEPPMGVMTPDIVEMPKAGGIIEVRTPMFYTSVLIGDNIEIRQTRNTNGDMVIVLAVDRRNNARYVRIALSTQTDLLLDSFGFSADDIAELYRLVVCNRQFLLSDFCDEYIWNDVEFKSNRHMLFIYRGYLIWFYMREGTEPIHVHVVNYKDEHRDKADYAKYWVRSDYTLRKADPSRFQLTIPEQVEQFISNNADFICEEYSRIHNIVEYEDKTSKVCV